MTYAYINNVYPNFKTEFPVVNYKEYRNIKNVSSNTTSNLENYSPFRDKLDDTIFKKSQIDTVKVSEINQQNQQNHQNLQFYNPPIKPQNYPMTDMTDLIETIDNTHTNPQLDHEFYIKHVSNCDVCKKRLNIELDRVKMDEWMELASYIVFGIFILLLIDSLKS